MGAPAAFTILNRGTIGKIFHWGRIVENCLLFHTGGKLVFLPNSNINIKGTVSRGLVRIFRLFFTILKNIENKFRILCVFNFFVDSN